jgi:hypothetical protein
MTQREARVEDAGQSDKAGVDDAGQSDGGRHKERSLAGNVDIFDVFKRLILKTRHGRHVADITTFDVFFFISYVVSCR